MKRTIITALCFLIIIGIGTIANQPVNAQENVITINPDGSVTPSNAPIQQSDAIYILTNDVSGNIKVNRSDCVLDGNGHTITYSGSEPGTPITISINNVSNVTIKNFNINSGWFGIVLYGSKCIIDNNTITNTGNGIYELDASTSAIKVAGDSNVISGNYLTHNFDGIWFYQAKDNLVIGNTIKDTGGSTGRMVNSAISFYEASNNTIYHNNFQNNSINYTVQVYNSGSCVNVWDNGYPSGGNYWSDNNETDPYVIDEYNRDNYPLTEKFDIKSVSIEIPTWTLTFTPSLTPIPTGSETTQQESSTQPNQTSAAQLPEISIVIVVSLFFVCILLVLFFKRRGIKKL